MNGAKVIPFLLACLYLGSCSRELETGATIRLSAQANDRALQAEAARLPGMTLLQYIAPDYWTNVLRRDKGSAEPHDLFVVDWGREIVAAEKDGSLAGLDAYWERTTASRKMPAFLASIRPTPAQGFIPSAVSMWGLFYNRRVFADFGAPSISDMDGLVALLDAAKRKGLVPIALGSSFGWPGAAWFTCIDLRLNGGKTAWERVMGMRPFDDQEGTSAAALLTTWRDAGYFSPDADRTVMEESLRAVETGKALFVLMSSTIASRLLDASEVGFMEVPFWKGRGEPRGEVGSLIGFAVASGSRHPQSALALVDAYLSAGSPGQTAGTSWLPIELGKSGGDQQGNQTGNDVQGIQSRALTKTEWLVPSLDRFMGAAFVQDSLRVWSGFFNPKSGGSGQALVAALQRLNAGAGEGTSP